MAQVLDVVVIHTVILAWYGISRLIFGPVMKRVFFGHYLILMPIGFAIAADPSMAYMAPFVMAGLVVLSVAYRRAMAT